MRLLLIAALMVTAFAGTVIVSSTEAGAAVCARGMRGAACAGPRGAVAVRGPAVVRPVVVRSAAACRTVIVRGVAVRRCI